MEAHYTRPYVAHASIGPSCSVARYEGGSLHVWSHTQGVFPLRGNLASLLGIPAERVIVPGKRDVGISSVDPIGHYAIRIHFDDGHDTGIYTWDYLLRLGQEQDARWQAYLAALAVKGLSREPQPARSARR